VVSQPAILRQRVKCERAKQLYGGTMCITPSLELTTLLKGKRAMGKLLLTVSSSENSEVSLSSTTMMKSTCSLLVTTKRHRNVLKIDTR
jgi:hypothetical protein